MKRVGMSALSLLLAAVILVGGYFAIDWIDACLTPAPAVTQVEKDSETAAVWRFDNGEPLRLYPFDRIDGQSFTEATYSREYLLAYGRWMHERQEQGEGTDEREFYVWMNECIYAPLLSWVLPEGVDIPDELPDMLGETKGQGTLYYLQDYPLTFIQNGQSVTRLFTAAFDTDFYLAPQVLFLALEPPADVPEKEDEDLEELAATLNREYDRYIQTDEIAVKTEIDVGEADYAYDTPDNVFAPVLQTVCEVVEWGDRYGYDGKEYEYFGTAIHAFDSRECVIYEDRMLFIAQSDTQRMVLLYSPALGEFYGFSLCTSL